MIALPIKKGVQTFAIILLHIFAQPFMQKNTTFIRNLK